VFMHDVCSRGSVRRRENSRATRSLTIRKVLTSSDWCPLFQRRTHDPGVAFVI